jgi:hypothetical protein
MRELGEDGLLDKPTPTRFDAAEWRAHSKASLAT